MDNILKNSKKIAEGGNSLIYLSELNDYKKSVVIKIPKKKSSLLSAEYQLHNEYNYLKSLNLHGVRKPIEKIIIDHHPALVLEYFEAATLREYINTRPFNLLDFLKVSIEICKTLSDIHHHNIIHKDINSHNILINKTGELRIIDFGIACKYNQHSDLTNSPEMLEGNLAYLSPEQTGRMNREIDKRSDLYSLGVVLYEWCAGSLPFPTKDPMKLIHSHLAVNPEPVNLLNTEVPNNISKIILKLLSKDKDDRYHSADGLRSDLELALKQFSEHGYIEGFPLGMSDFSGQLSRPQKLYGREKELHTLVQAFHKAYNKEKQVVLISGPSGSGKSALAIEVNSQFSDKSGHFIYGKFDELHRDKPYLAIKNAFRKLVNNILAEDKEVRQAWKKSILEEVGKEAQLLIEVIPELVNILGPQPEVPKLGSEETKNRFSYIFRQFIKAVATASHPLVLFIDDVQWSDPASLTLLSQITNDASIPYLFIILTLRSESDSAIHSGNFKFTDQLELSVLSPQHVQSLLVDSLSKKCPDAEKLAQVIYMKTGGNAFFVNQFIQKIYQEGFLFFNTKKQQWDWKLKEIESLQVTKNVIDLLHTELKKLPAECLDLLQTGSCLNEYFNLKIISSIHSASEEDIKSYLWDAVEKGFIKVSVNQKVVNNTEDYGLGIEYSFAHDKIKKSAYESLSSSQTLDRHWKIGKYLYNNQDKYHVSVFDIVFHWNIGIEHAWSEKLTNDLLNLNFLAGNEARSSAAYMNALEYYRHALKISTGDIWTEFYDLALAVHTGAAETAFLTGKMSVMQEHIIEVLAHAKNIHEKIKVYQIQIQAYIAQGQSVKAVDAALGVLGQLDIIFPAKPTTVQIGKELLRTSIKLSRKNKKQLLTLPPMTDQKALASMQIMASVGSAVSRTTPTLFPLMVFKMIHLSLKYGNSMESIPNYGGYGIIQVGALKNFKAGLKYGELTRELLERHNPDPIKAKTLIVYYSFVHPWKYDLKESLKPLMDTYHIGMETGDHEFAASALMVNGFYSYFSGEVLSKLDDKMAAHAQKIQQLNQELLYTQHSIFHQVIQNLLGKNNKPEVLEGNQFSASEVITEKFRANNSAAAFYADFHTLVLSIWFKKFENGYKSIALLDKNLNAVLGTIFVPQYHFYRGISLCSGFHTLSEKEKKQARKKITEGVKVLKTWSDSCPYNYLHMYYLLSAESLRVKGKNPKAKLFYDLAIVSANKHGFLNDEALCYELAGEFCKASKEHYPFEIYLKKAHDTYMHWGAEIKARNLSDQYPFISLNSVGHINVEESLSTTTGNYSNLELSSILKASTAIASKIQLDRLLETLLKIVLENAGAQSGYLLSVKDNDLIIRAKGHASSEKVEVFEDLRLATYDHLPSSIIQYAGKIREEIIMDDASLEHRFSNDPYFHGNDVKSILCSPIIKQNELIGIIYLENNLIPGAFTQKRLEMLQLLSGQIAVSLDNALLYENMEQAVKERTQEIKAQQEVLKEYNKDLLALNDEKDHLISVVAHDLRSPLNQIKGMVNLIKLTSQDKSNEQLEFINIVLDSTERLGNMISRILDVNAIEAKKIDLKFEMVNLSDMMQKLLNNFKLTANEKKINLELDIEGNYLSSLDKNYTIQVFENILSNALKFSPSGKSILVNVKGHNQNVLVSIRDQGPGISEEDMKRLFMPYQKLSAQPTAGEQSTGLGLSIVKKYVEAMEGKIWCESTEGEGATFFVEFKKF
ncbi:sensor histidine kinase [Fulvivirga ligni]|uniref:sensor histidine kinase n=1 Tax=Fulvivirga ligni TaxID=2904246 RepID=UPI001F33D003|nr:AAA family ATPase [Fulvivirga ligni]UII19481.1 AAA family ATPase [Fulvivirga ligni]